MAEHAESLRTGERVLYWYQPHADAPWQPVEVVAGVMWRLVRVPHSGDTIETVHGALMGPLGHPKAGV